MVCIALSCALSTGISVGFEGNRSTESMSRAIFTDEWRSTTLPTSELREVGDSELPFLTKTAARFSASGPTQPPAILHAIDSKAKTADEIQALWQASYNYVGNFKRDVSRYSMKKNFDRQLRSRVYSHVLASKGGIIEEFGALHVRRTHVCEERPTLQLSDVHHLARTSFGIPNFKISFPPCDGVAVSTRCKYETGRCCTRPQTEFLGRYYDTAVAAMALGATREEAFAPLTHSRILAYTLQSCDPKLNLKGYSRANSIKVAVQDKRFGPRYTNWYIPEVSTIAIPKAYEVLYELYNTMLIERMRSRRSTRFPSDTQMKKLNDAVYYKKMVARCAPLNRDLNPAVVFPNSRDFRSASLRMASSRMANLTEPNVESTSDLELHPSLRYTEDRIKLHEGSSDRWVSLDYSVCNQHLSSNPYYALRFQKYVWSRWEGCCAKECQFMALYGNTFSENSANCCSGCNRFRCSANSFSVANFLAKISVVEASSKLNVGAEEMSFTV